MQSQSIFTRGFSTYEVASILNINKVTLQGYVERDFVVPSIRKASGIGVKSLFSDADICVIELFRTLCVSGLSNRKASMMSKTISFNGIDSNSHGLFLVLKKIRDTLDHEYELLDEHELSKNILEVMINQYANITIINLVGIKGFINSILKRM